MSARSFLVGQIVAHCCRHYFLQVLLRSSSMADGYDRTINGIIWFMFVLCIITSVLRIITRSRQGNHFDWDDYVMFLAVVRSLPRHAICPLTV